VLARELGAYLLVIDEKRGRKTAEQLGLRVIGVIGLLRLAIDKGILPLENIDAVLSRLTQVGFRFKGTITG
jgi:predicted nucleic acid-binding protein